MTTPHPITSHPDGLFETKCADCGEPILFGVGDKIHVRVDDDKDLHHLCSICYMADQK